MNASAKDLAREAMLYDEIGHRREALQLLRHAGRVCPQAPEKSAAWPPSSSDRRTRTSPSSSGSGAE